MIRAVVFDLDNTLVDFMAMKKSAVQAAIVAMIDAGLTLTPAVAEEKINTIYKEQGIEYQKVFNDFLRNEYSGDFPQAILAAGIVAYRRAREAALVPYPHVHHTMAQLFRKGLLLGVLSDAPRHEAWLRIAYLNLHHFFNAVVTFEDTGEKKPSEKPFREVLKKLGVSPEETIMIGDWPERDMVGAKAVGMTTVFARYGAFVDAQDVHTDYAVDDIAEIIPIIEGLNSRK